MNPKCQRIGQTKTCGLLPFLTEYRIENLEYRNQQPLFPGCRRQGGQKERVLSCFGLRQGDPSRRTHGQFEKSRFEELTRPVAFCWRSHGRMSPVVAACLPCGRDRLPLQQFGKVPRKPPFVIAVSPIIHQTRCAAHIAMIFLRPLDNLYIPGAIFHCFDSSMADFTARGKGQSPVGRCCALFRC